MDDNRDQPHDPSSPPRRFVYRSANQEKNHAHPLRRATDVPRPFQGIPGQLCPKTKLLKFRVYLKVN